MQPRVSIIIPVYNAEKYLRECLDSVLNQTMRDIQVICVNDGSTDGSRTILQEYADRDHRIEIIDKPNGGQASARNAAYPEIKGKYTLFVDSDDWIDLDLCEKTCQKAEETGAELTVFSYHKEYEHTRSNPDYEVSPGDKTTVEEKLPLVNLTTVCGKLWRTDFLLGNTIYFPEGLVYEDAFVHWKSVTLADKISVMPDRFYHYRIRSDSTMHSKGEHVMDTITISNKIREYLFETGYYASYRDMFILRRLRTWHSHYRFGLPPSMRARYIANIRESLSSDDREFCRTAPETLIPRHLKRFYAMIDGNTIDALKYYIEPASLPTHFRWLAQFFPQWVAKPIEKGLKKIWKMLI